MARKNSDIAKIDITKTGTLIKVADKPDIYVIRNSKKERISDPQTFNVRGYKWNLVQVISNDDMASIPDFVAVTDAMPVSKLVTIVSRGSLVKTSDNPTVYYITNAGTKKPILNITVFNAHNNKWENVKLVSQETLEEFPTVKAMRLRGGDGKVYLMEYGKKRWIKTWEVLQLLTFAN